MVKNNYSFGVLNLNMYKKSSNGIFVQKKVRDIPMLNMRKRW